MRFSVEIKRLHSSVFLNRRELYVCLLHFTCVYVYSCVCVCVVGLTHTHRLMPSCEPSHNCCQSNPPNTQTETQRLRSRSPLRTHNTRKHPSTPTDRAAGRHLGPLRDKSRDTLEWKASVRGAEWTHCPAL